LSSFTGGALTTYRPKLSIPEFCSRPGGAPAPHAPPPPWLRLRSTH